MPKKFRISTEALFVIILIALIGGGTAWMAISSIRYEKTEKARWNAMTPEEQAAETKAKQDAYNARIHNYQLVSIFPYMHTETNNFGGITDEEVRYNIIYITPDGATHTDDSFTGAISIGDADIFRVNDNVNQYDSGHTTVILTQETASKLQMKQ